MRLIDADALKTELEKLRDGWNYYGGEYESAMYQAYDISVDTVDEQPTVQSQRKKGKWIEVEVRNVYATLKCSVCGRVIEPFFDFCKYSYEDIKRSYPYCHCGAEMSGGGEDEVSN